ncbi:hypothetical protein K1719_011589 [Acacia pycnantha]|nr:hypothetical protein K1719_011589 [Acacia pycnantha]
MHSNPLSSRLDSRRNSSEEVIPGSATVPRFQGHFPEKNSDQPPPANQPPPYQVEYLTSEAENSKALVPFVGLSPLSAVTTGVRNLNIKRAQDAEEDDWLSNPPKKRLLFLENHQVPSGVPPISYTSPAHWLEDYILQNEYTADEFSPLQGHLLKYPIHVDVNGKVLPIPGYENFPDVGGKILGGWTPLPDVLTT